MKMEVVMLTVTALEAMSQFAVIDKVCSVSAIG
jgi:hypothetical protein